MEHRDPGDGAERRWPGGLRNAQGVLNPRWEPTIYLVLDDGREPMRHSTIIQELRRSFEDPLADGSFNRVLKKLQAKGAVKQDVDNGHPVYSLTDAGRVTAQKLRIVSELFADGGDDEPPDADPGE